MVVVFDLSALAQPLPAPEVRPSWVMLPPQESAEAAERLALAARRLVGVTPQPAPDVK